jgi:hypothetical protein
MEFACPKCSVSEIIIGDTTPLCMKCRVPMVKATNEYTDLWLSPNFAIRRFRTVIGKHGWAAALKGRVKKEREACIAAIWALGIQRITGKRYWIEIVTNDSTPDCRVMFLDQSTGHNKRMIMHVEIVEWELHRDSMLEVIEQKCTRGYPDYFFLVVFVRNDKITLVEDILQKIRSINVPFAEIWIVGRLPISIGSYKMFKAHPEPTRTVDFDVFESYRMNLKQGEYLKFEGRGMSTEMRDLGLVYLPIP